MDNVENLNESWKNPNIFQYLDFKKYLREFYLYKKQSLRSYSYAAFANRAKLRTPNYLKRVIDGERPLSSENIAKFCVGLNLNPKESIYFEALVNFNQSVDQSVRKHYFSVLRQSAKGEDGSAVELVADQFEVFLHWFILPVRELVLLNDFVESPEYIVKKLKNKITKKQAASAIELLLKVDLLQRNEQGRLVQSSPVIRYSQDVVNLAVREFHHQMLDRSKQSMQEDEFDSWNVRALSIAVTKEKISKIHQELNDFINQINIKYSDSEDKNNEANEASDKEVVLQINSQVVQLTQ